MKNHFKIGCHVSAAGGVFNAPKNASDLGCEVFQFFSRPPQGGLAVKITKEIVAQFNEQLSRYYPVHSDSAQAFTGKRIHPVGKTAITAEFVIHAPYYINFGSANPKIFHNSVSIMRAELERGSLLGAKFVMFHPGSINGNTVNGFAQAKTGLQKVLDGYNGTTELLIEISAGAGKIIGDTFEEIAELMKPIKNKAGFGGICFDTQHAFASGYDLRTEKSALNVLRKFDQTIGLTYLRMSHINDSKVMLGSHKDRHEHIGDGFLGDAGIKHFLRALDKSVVKSKNKNAFLLILETAHDKIRADIKKLKRFVVE